MFQTAFRCLTTGLLLMSTVQAQSPSPSSLKTLAVGKSPESVCQGFGDKLYVTMINGDEPGDGTIVVVDGDTVKEFARGLNSPKGLVFVGNTLVTADETTLRKIDQNGNVTTLAEAKDFPGSIEFLNDVAASRDGESVYVSEMSNPGPMFDPSGERKLWDLESSQAKELPRKGCVYRVTLKGQITQAVPPGDPALRYPNGLAIGGPRDQERLFVADFFSGNIVRQEGGNFEVVASGLRGVDGLAVTREAFYASSWTDGKVVRVDRATGDSKVILEGLKTAADFFHDRKNQQLIIPDMVAGTLVFLPLE
jgi:hypothetical protein